MDEQDEVGPAPEGVALVVEVQCRTSRNASRGARHPVTIRPDWTLETPHDLDAERVAAAFGGYCSCLDLADRVVPALRVLLQRLARRTDAGIRHVRGRGWMVSEPSRSCRCARTTYTAAHVAAEHARTVAHVAASHGIAERDLVPLVRAAEAAWGPFRAVPPTGWHVAHLVREPFGLDELWGAGLHPQRIAEDATLVPGCDEPLPAWFFLGVEFHRPDRDWLARTLAHCPDPDVATWLAWSDAAVDARGDDCGRWLAMGASRSEIEVLLGEGVPPDAATGIASITGRTPRRAAQTLAAWARAGCRPTPEHISVLDRFGLGSYEPSGPALDLLVAVAADLDELPSRTELGVMLALLGGRAVVLDLLHGGARTPADVVARASGETAPDQEEGTHPRHREAG